REKSAVFQPREAGPVGVPAVRPPSLCPDRAHEVLQRISQRKKHVWISQSGAVCVMEAFAVGAQTGRPCVDSPWTAPGCGVCGCGRCGPTLLSTGTVAGPDARVDDFFPGQPPRAAN